MKIVEKVVSATDSELIAVLENASAELSINEPVFSFV